MKFLNINIKKISLPFRVFFIFSALLIEIFYCIFLWCISTPQIKYAYLIKDGPKYTILWKLDGSYESQTYENLFEAVNFLKNNGLTLHKGELVNFDIEYLTLGETRGYYELKWKLSNFKFLHRLSFKDKSEALYFERAIKQGAYSPSPFGHSILFLLPKKS